MKTKIIYIISALLLISAVIFTESCTKKDFDVPPLYTDFEMPAGATIISIDSLKRLHNAASTSLDTVKNFNYIHGTVISNDSCGNVYKYLSIQDTSGAIFLKIENDALYKMYRPGQKVYVKCKDLVLGSRYISSSGNPHTIPTQLGYQSGTVVGTILDLIKSKYIFKDSLPNVNLIPQPLVFTAFNQLDAATLCGKLITIKNVHIDPETYGSLYNAGNAAPVRKLVDSTGIDYSLYTSPYACFALDTMPTGNIDVTCILSTYDGEFQFVIRTTKDIVPHTNAK